MPPTCHLHVGGYKTGTTYLQERLIKGRPELRAGGVLVPGSGGIAEHVRAGKVILERKDLRGRPIPAAEWHRLRDEMLGFDGHTAVYSYEELCAATRQQVRRMITDLQPADVRVVLTARDFVRVIPAAWQEVVQGGQQWTWAQFADTVTSRAGRTIPPGRTFWRNNDLAAVAERWAAVAGADKVTVVTVPPRGAAPGELWRRYCTALGIDPALVTTDVAPANESLDPVCAELLRRFNVRAAEALPVHVYDRVVKWFIGKEVLAARSGPMRVALDERQTAWAQEYGERTVQELQRLGVRIVGDPADLVGAAQPGVVDPEPSAEEMLDAALDVMAALVGRLGDRPGREPAGAGARAQGRAQKDRLGSMPQAGPATRQDPSTGDSPGVGARAAAADDHGSAGPTPAQRARRLGGRLLRETYERTRR